MGSDPSHTSASKPPVVLIALVAGFGACVVYPPVKIHAAHRHADALCAAYPVGAPFDYAEFERRANELHLAPYAPPANPRGPTPPHAFAMAGWAFARWACNVEFTDGKITESRVGFLD
jgi:hypothetical protein